MIFFIDFSGNFDKNNYKYIFHSLALTTLLDFHKLLTNNKMLLIDDTDFIIVFW